MSLVLEFGSTVKLLHALSVLFPYIGNTIRLLLHLKYNQYIMDIPHPPFPIPLLPFHSQWSHSHSRIKDSHDLKLYSVRFCSCKQHDNGGRYNKVMPVTPPERVTTTTTLLTSTAQGWRTHKYTSGQQCLASSPHDHTLHFEFCTSCTSTHHLTAAHNVSYVLLCRIAPAWTSVHSYHWKMCNFSILLWVKVILNVTMCIFKMTLSSNFQL